MANLSHYGDCWVYDYDNAKVFGDAEISGCAGVFENAEIYGCAEIHGNAEIYGCAEIGGNAEIYGDAKIGGNTEIYEDAASGSAIASESAPVTEVIKVAELDIKEALEAEFKKISDWNSEQSNISRTGIEQIRKNVETCFSIRKYLDPKRG